MEYLFYLMNQASDTQLLIGLIGSLIVPIILLVAIYYISKHIHKLAYGLVLTVLVSCGLLAIWIVPTILFTK